MKLFRTIAMLLVLVLASSPALAAICATNCASQSVMSSLHVNDSDMSGMQHCHEDSTSTDTNKSSAEHPSCDMGAGCHFTQIVFPFDTVSKYLYADLSSAAFPKFVPAGKSVDLSPPLKPPA